MKKRIIALTVLLSLIINLSGCAFGDGIIAGNENSAVNGGESSTDSSADDSDTKPDDEAVTPDNGDDESKEEQPDDSGSGEAVSPDNKDDESKEEQPDDSGSGEVVTPDNGDDESKEEGQPEDSGKEENGNTNDDPKPGGNPTVNQGARYWGSYLIESYDELEQAFALVNASSEGGFTQQYYTFDDTVGEKYKALYFFTFPNAWIEYPISFEDYFSIPYLGDVVEFSSYLVDVDGGECDCGNNARHSILIEINDERIVYEKCAYIQIISYISQPVEIENPDLLRKESLDGATGYKYIFKYDGVRVFEINSCKPLSNSDIDEIISHVVII